MELRDIYREYRGKTAEPSKKTGKIKKTEEKQKKRKKKKKKGEGGTEQKRTRVKSKHGWGAVGHRIVKS